MAGFPGTARRDKASVRGPNVIPLCESVCSFPFASGAGSAFQWDAMVGASPLPWSWVVGQVKIGARVKQWRAGLLDIGGVPPVEIGARGELEDMYPCVDWDYGRGWGNAMTRISKRGCRDPSEHLFSLSCAFLGEGKDGDITDDDHARNV